MKFCKKCNKFYPEEARFCPVCGERLEEPLKTDIFGDVMDKRINDINKNNITENITSDPNEPYCIYKDNNVVSRNKTISLIFTIACFIFWLIPVIGTIEILITFYNNYKLYQAKLVKKSYIIVPIVCLCLSVAFMILYYTFVNKSLSV